VLLPVAILFKLKLPTEIGRAVHWRRPGHWPMPFVGMQAFIIWKA